MCYIIPLMNYTESQNKGMVIKQFSVHYMVLSGFPKGSQYQFILLNGEGHCKSKLSNVFPQNTIQ